MGDRLESTVAALQLGDGSLPIGRYAHSHGLEALLAADRALDEPGLAELVHTYVTESAGPLDGVAVARAHRAAGAGDLAALVELDRSVTARKLAPGARAASTSCGRALAGLVPALGATGASEALAQRVRAGASDGNLAVMEGALAADLGIPCELAVALEVRGAAAALLSAAVRLGRLSASRAQALLASLAPAIATASLSAATPGAELRATAVELEVHALAHDRAQGRLFAS